jgi:hypothetical protein
MSARPTHVIAGASLAGATAATELRLGSTVAELDLARLRGRPRRWRAPA